MPEPRRSGFTGPNGGPRSELKCLGPELLECQPKRQPRIAVVEDR